MKENIAKLWVSQLRSGTYRQGNTQLRTNDDCHCVLGVLAELAVVYKVVTREKTENGYSYDGKKFELPEKILEWSGLKNPHGFALCLGISLMQMNDRGKSFRELADIIEGNIGNL